MATVLGEPGDPGTLNPASQHPSTAKPGRLRALQGTLLLSGFAGLGFEMVWTHRLGVVLGHEILAVLAVLAAFFVGLGLGAWLLSERINTSARPARWYAALELIIAGWALALLWLIPMAQAVLPHWLGRDPSASWHWFVAFGSTALLLLPATFAMGGTLPAMTRTVATLIGQQRSVAGLYGANTFGAVLGTLVTTFLLVPQLGFSQTLWLCAALNVSCAVLVLLLSREILPAQPTAETPTPDALPLTNRSLLALLAATGFLGLAFEVAVIRVLSQVLEDTAFTFAIVLCVYLFGTAVGASLWQRREGAGSLPTLRLLLLGLSLTCASGSGLLYVAEPIYDWLAIEGFGAGTLQALAGEALVASLVFLLPTMLMGATFSLLAEAADARGLLGRAVGANTLAAALAPLAVGVVAIPMLGHRGALLLIVLAYGLLAVLLRPQPDRRGWIALTAPALAVLALALAPPLRILSLTPTQQVVAYRDGVMASVAVVESYAGVRYLKVNNHFSMGSTSSGFADHRQTHLPLLLHPAPQSALVLGVGTGMSLNAAQHHPNLAVTAVELLPEALDMLEHFDTAVAQNDWRTAPTLLSSDARRFVLADDQRYDVVIADLFHPSRDGAGGLYTVEHFRAIGERLADGGLFVQWLPLFQMDRETLELIMRSFATAFRHMQVHLPHFSISQPIIGLVGSHEPLAYGPRYLQTRVTDERLQQQLVALRLNTNFALFGGFIGDHEALAATSTGLTRNVDDRPLVTYRAPRFAYEQRAAHGERLGELISDWAPHRSTLLGVIESPEEDVFSSRLKRYWLARDAYIALGASLPANASPERIQALTTDGLLNIVAQSEDFDPAYRPLMHRVESLLQQNPAAAIELLTQMVEAAPGRLEARNALRYLRAELGPEPGRQP